MSAENEARQKPKVGIFYIATKKYNMFWDEFKSSADTYFCPDAEKTYFLFTDREDLTDTEDTKVIHIEHKPWPYITLYRFRILLNAYDLWKDMTYVCFCNSNMVFCSTMYTIEAFGCKPLMACVHPCASGSISKFSLESNPKSTAFCPVPTVYLAGGFQGGRTNMWKRACELMDAGIREDEKNGITALWHDESHWNKFCVINSDKIHVLGWPTLYVQPHPWVKAWLRDKNKFFDKQKME